MNNQNAHLINSINRTLTIIIIFTINVPINFFFLKFCVVCFRFMTYKIILIYVFILKTEVIQLKHKSLIYLIFNLITLRSG